MGSAEKVPGGVEAVPVLRVADAERSVAWWGRLGFVEEFRHQFGPGMPWFVGVTRDERRIYLSEHTGDAPPGGLVYLWVPDVDAAAAEFGVAVETESWARECELVDPDGNRVRVATAT